MRIWLLALLGLICSPLLGQEAIWDSLEHGCLQRHYLSYVPTSYEDSVALPLVLNLHGFLSDPESQAIYADLPRLAEQEGFIAVHPQGLIGQTPWGEGPNWNAYLNEAVDDLGFLNQLLDQLLTTYAIDPQRVYVMGLSNGGFMAHRLGCELSGRIAAIASVNGTMRPEQLAHCQPGYVVPVLQIHGTEDKQVPYRGNRQFLGAEEVVEFWGEKHGCESESISLPWPESSTTDASSVVFHPYADCEADAEVWFFQIEGGGHTWPGSSVELITLGPTNQDLAATEIIWEFFSRFSHPNPQSDFLPGSEASFCPPIWQQEAGSLNISWPRGVPAQWAIFAMDGRLIDKNEAPEAQREPLWFSLPSGAYVLWYEREGQFFVKKLLLTR